MKIWHYIIVIIPFLIMLFVELYANYKLREVILVPIKKYVNTRCGVRGKIINLYNSYNMCSNREIITQNQVLKFYSGNSTPVDNLVDLFTKLLFPLLTFLLLFTVNWVTKVFDTVNSKIDNDDVNKLMKAIDAFQEELSKFYYGPIGYIFTATLCLVVVSMATNAIAQSQKNFLSLHKEVVDRIIMERKLEDAKLSDK